MKKILTTVAMLIAAGVASPASGDLIVSEYIEGSSNNKAIELFNTGTSNIDLALLSVNRYSNGSASPAQIVAPGAATGALLPGEVFTIANSSWALGGTIDLSTGGANWNGDDAVEVLVGGITVDVVGQIGFDPGSEWGSGLVSTQNNTLTRNTNILTGDADGSDAFDPSLEWRGGAQNSHSLGTHDGSFSTAVPEPSGIALLGLVGLAGAARRRR